ncbi:helix-turn-helix transcriptional regulator [Streptomyces albulus]|nr:helix-turn-helix transcriptional regulator [Streptomyces noursei]
MPEPVDTGRRIKELRVSAGMTQHELAGPDISASYISLVERGKRIPSGRALKILAGRLGVGMADISGGAARAESAGRVRRLDLVGRLVATRRQWEAAIPKGRCGRSARWPAPHRSAGRTTCTPRPNSPSRKYWARRAAPTTARPSCCGCWTASAPPATRRPGCAP